MAGKLKYTQRMSIACKTLLTDDEFEALANDPHPKIRIKIAQRTDATQTAINRLAEDSERNIRIVIAQHKSISAEALDILANDPSPKVRAYVVRNKNLSPNALIKLSKHDHPENNRSTAKNWHTPFKALENLAGNNEEMVRCAVAKNIKTPAYIVDRLLSDQSRKVQYSLLKRQDLSEEQLLSLTRSLYKYVRQKAYQKLLNAEGYVKKHKLIEEMTRDEYTYIRATAAQSNHISTESLSRLVNDRDSHVRHYAASHPSLSLQTLKMLANDEYDSVRRGVALNPNCSSDILTHLSFDVSDFVRRDVARNENTPIEVLKKFISDPSHFVRSNLAENKAAPVTWLRDNLPKEFLTEPILRTLEYRDKPPSKQLRARDPNTPLKELQSLLNWTCNLKELREEIGDDYDRYGWTEDGLKKRAKDEEMRLLSALASNHALPLELLDNICMRAFDHRQKSPLEASYVLLRAIQHPRMTRKLLDKIASRVDELITPYSNSDSNKIKKLLCSHPDASAESLKQIAASKAANDYVYLRAAIARNPSTPEETLTELAQDSEFIVKFRLIQRDNIPSKIGAIFMNDPVMAEIYQERLCGGYSTRFKVV